VSLEDLSETVETVYGDIEETPAVDLDRETRQELAMLLAALETDEVDELLRRGVHELFRAAVESGQLDFHLRTGYDVTYDEYLSGMTYDEMAGGSTGRDDDDRRYQF
jgi:hypothetical protein